MWLSNFLGLVNLGPVQFILFLSIKVSNKQIKTLFTVLTFMLGDLTSENAGSVVVLFFSDCLKARSWQKQRTRQRKSKTKESNGVRP